MLGGRPSKEMSYLKLFLAGTAEITCCMSTTDTCIILSHWVVWLATPWTIACQVPLPMGFSSQEYWSRLPFPSPGDIPNPGIEPAYPPTPALAGILFTTEPPEKPGHSLRLHHCAALSQKPWEWGRLVGEDGRHFFQWVLFCYWSGKNGVLKSVQISKKNATNKYLNWNYTLEESIFLFLCLRWFHWAP